MNTKELDKKIDKVLEESEDSARDDAVQAILTLIHIVLDNLQRQVPGFKYKLIVD